jgi:VanZ family protein
MSTTLARLAAWLLAVAIVVLSVVPPSDRPVVGPHVIEHALAFGALGVLAALAYARAQVAVGLLVFCVAIESVQLWVPGRHARLADLIVDIGASLLGVAAVALLDQPAWRKRLGAVRDKSSS